MLHYRADLRPLFFNALYFAILALAWFLPPASWLSIATLLVVLCITSFQGAVQTHNAIHRPIFKIRWLNKIYQVVLTLVYGHPVSSYVPGHNLSHHKHTQSQRDVMRTSKAQFSYNLFNFFFFIFLVAPDIMRADGAYAKAMRDRHPRWHRQLRMEQVILWAVNIGLLVLDWQKALVYWFVPHFFAQWGIITTNLLQHDGCDEDSEWNHSRNFVSPLFNFFVFNNGFHTIHHMRPGLHWSRTRNEHKKTVSPHIHKGLEEPSIVAFIWRYFVLNRRERYDGTPFSPKPAGEDESWIPTPRETPMDLGAEALEEATRELAEHVRLKTPSQAS